MQPFGLGDRSPAIVTLCHIYLHFYDVLIERDGSSPGHPGSSYRVKFTFHRAPFFNPVNCVGSLWSIVAVDTVLLTVIVTVVSLK